MSLCFPAVGAGPACGILPLEIMIQARLDSGLRDSHFAREKRSADRLRLALRELRS